MSVEIVNRIVTDKGFTEKFDEETVRVLLTLGLIFHQRTDLYNDCTIRQYSHIRGVDYAVKDYRSNVLSLEDQYPRRVG